MNVVIYMLCVVLMLPAIGFAAFGLLIDGLTKFGLWEMIKFLFSPLYDPFGKGIWIILILCGSSGLILAGFFDNARPYGFGAIAVIGVLSTIAILRTYPGPWEIGNIFFFIPGFAATFWSVFCIVRPVR